MSLLHHHANLDRSSTSLSYKKAQFFFFMSNSVANQSLDYAHLIGEIYAKHATL